MTSMDINTIIANMAATLATVEGLVTVTTEEYAQPELDGANMPAVVLIQGPTRHGDFIARTQQLFTEIMVDLRITDEDYTLLNTLKERIIDAINSDLTLDDSCILCDYVMDTNPVKWPRSNCANSSIFYDIQYWRDID